MKISLIIYCLIFCVMIFFLGRTVGYTEGKAIGCKSQSIEIMDLKHEINSRESKVTLQHQINDSVRLQNRLNDAETIRVVRDKYNDYIR